MEFIDLDCISDEERLFFQHEVIVYGRTFRHEDLFLFSEDLVNKFQELTYNDEAFCKLMGCRLDIDRVDVNANSEVPAESINYHNGIADGDGVLESKNIKLNIVRYS